MSQLTTYFSAQYLALFLPVVVILMAVLPQKGRRWTLLISSYLLFWAFSGKLVVFLILSTFSVHHFGLWLDSLQHECDAALECISAEERKAFREKTRLRQRNVIILAVTLHIGLLVALKYTPFFSENVNTVLEFFGSSFRIAIPKLAIPIGISFYTLQAVSYMFDVYRRKIKADKNLLRVAMYMSFFPQIMEGPIVRYTDTAEKLWNVEKVKYNNFVCGSLRITFGMAKKIVVADRLNLFISNVFTSYEKYDGFIIALAAVLYTVQLYMEFSGTMDLVLGSGQIFGITMPENFKRPFFSSSISEFWKRWHITLGTWFRDYMFYPVSMSKPLKKLTSKARKRLGNHLGPLTSGAIALFCVWLCNGLWHGAGWNYIFFGMYHFVLILCGSIIEPYSEIVLGKMHINRASGIYRGFRILRTTVLVCIGELFFRAVTLSSGFAMFGKIFSSFTLASVQNGDIFKTGMDLQDFIIVAIAVSLVFIVSLLQEKGIKLSEIYYKKNVAVRFAVIYALILFIVIFGAYGRGYVPVEPIYAGF